MRSSSVLVTLLVLAGCTAATSAERAGDTTAAVTKETPHVIAEGDTAWYVDRVVLDESYAYWTTSSLSYGGGIMATSLAGGAPVLAQKQGLVRSAIVAAPDGEGGVYCLNAGGLRLLLPSGDGFVVDEQTDWAPDSMAAAAGRLWAFVETGNRLYLSEHASQPLHVATLPGVSAFEAMAATPRGVFLANSYSGKIRFVSLADKAVTNVAVIDDARYGMFPVRISAVDATVFWVSPKDGAVWMATIDGQAKELAKHGFSDSAINPIAADERRVYFADMSEIVSVRWPEGDDRRVLATDQKGISGISLNARSVAWSQFAPVVGGSVQLVPKVADPGP